LGSSEYAKEISWVRLWGYPTGTGIWRKEAALQRAIVDLIAQGHGWKFGARLRRWRGLSVALTEKSLIRGVGARGEYQVCGTSHRVLRCLAEGTRARIVVLLRPRASFREIKDRSGAVLRFQADVIGERLAEIGWEISLDGGALVIFGWRFQS